MVLEGVWVSVLEAVLLGVWVSVLEAVAVTVGDCDVIPEVDAVTLEDDVPVPVLVRVGV